MDIGKFSCMPIVDLLPVAKRSNVENKAGDIELPELLSMWLGILYSDV
jgi:hypothetical protein